MRRTPLLVQRGTGMAAGVLLIALIVTGCGSDPMPTPSVSPSASMTPTAAPVVVPTTEIAPLTGVTVPIGSVDGASIAAKIDNLEAARPQVGLEDTDIVFEELVEGGLTRYVAIWQSNVPKTIGPVRSIRPMDPAILSPFGGIVAYSGGQERFVEMMKDTPVYNAIHGQADTEDTFYRESTRVAPHNVLVKAREVIADHKNIDAPVQQFVYAKQTEKPTAVASGVAIEKFRVKFSDISERGWKWNAEKAAFVRSQDGEKDYDDDGDQLKATNVVVMEVDISNGYGVPKTELKGTGKAWISTGGRMVEATWSKNSKESAIRFVDGNGLAVRLAPGNTWFELMPEAGSVKFTKVPVVTPTATVAPSVAPSAG